MKVAVAFGVICMQLSCSYALPRNQGVGAYAYQDSAGNRYGGTYGLRDGQLINYDNDVTTFGPSPFTDFQDIDTFFPEYFRNLEYFVRQAFEKNSENQRLALDAAKKAYDVTSGQTGYNPASHNFGFDRFAGAPSFGFLPTDFAMPFDQDPFGFQNSAFAAGSVGPGYQRQAVNINPPNPKMPNVDVSQFSDPQLSSRSGAGDDNNGGFYSVSSSSYASSSNVDGKQKNQRGGSTIVNNNGKITKYSVNS